MSRTRACLKVTFLIGDDVQFAIGEARRLAELLDAIIEFDANGILLSVGPATDPGMLFAFYRDAVGKKAS